MCMFPKIPIQWIIFKEQCGNEQISSVLPCYLLHDMKYAVISQSQENFFASIIFSGLYKAFTKCIMLSWCHFACCSKMSGLQMPFRNFTNIWLTRYAKKKTNREYNRIIVGALNIWLKERFLSKVTYRYGPRDCHTEWSKPDREYHMLSLTCGI